MSEKDQRNFFERFWKKVFDPVGTTFWAKGILVQRYRSCPAILRP